MSVVSGLHEFVFSLHVSERKRLLAFWAGLGFQPHAEGALNAADAEALYGHGAALTSIRLRHSGCAAHETGLVRLQCWGELAGEGLGEVDVGGRGREQAQGDDNLHGACECFPLKQRVQPFAWQTFPGWQFAGFLNSDQTYERRSQRGRDAHRWRIAQVNIKVCSHNTLFVGLLFFTPERESV